MHLSEKIEAARQLELLGVDIIEAGFPIASAGDFESVKAISALVKNAAVAGLSRATKQDIERSAEALKGAVHPRIHTFIATSDIHLEYKLKMSKTQVLEKAYEMVKHARNLCADVQFSAEDATRSNWEFLRDVCNKVILAGATTINIPDTVGYTTPEEMYNLIKYLRENVCGADKITFAVHCHNDLGLAVANSLAGVRAGAGQVECTVNGLGERAGNAGLEEVVMALKTRESYFGATTKIKTQQISRSSKLIYGLIGQPVPLNKPIVGVNAFLHESGIHQHGVLANKETYEIMTPESVGIVKSKMVLGKHSGKHALIDRLKDLNINLTGEEIEGLFARFKELCDKKKIVTDRDIEALAKGKQVEGGAYKLVHFETHAAKGREATSTIKIATKNNVLTGHGEGNGPIDAAYDAIDKALGMTCSLEAYRIDAASEDKDALGEVTLRLKIDNQTRTGRGSSTDIIEASILAYINAINKG
jgi:2-isopropylmalate synthase